MTTALLLKIGAESSALRGELAKANGMVNQFAGQMTKLGGVIAGAFTADAIIQFTSEAVKMAAQMEGVSAAFNKLPQANNLLNQLRLSTKNTVNDLELMKAAVKAENFKIPLDTLGNLLQFASIKAQETGQSVDYLVESLITGIGRQSLPILDNLQISATEVRDELQKVGDFGVAVGNIVSEGLKTMNINLETSATKSSQLAASFDNLKLSFGSAANGTGFIGSAVTGLSTLINLFSVMFGGEMVRTKEDVDRAALALVFFKKKYDEAINSGHRDEAMKYAKAISDLASANNFLKDKAIEYSETAAKPQIKTIASLTQELQNLQLTYSQTDINDTNRLTSLNIEIKQLEEKIKKLRELGIAQQQADERPRRELKSFTPDPVNAAGALVDPQQITAQIQTSLQNLSAVAVATTPAISTAFIDMSAQVQGAMAGMAMGFGESIGNMLTGVGGLEQLAAAVVGGFGAMAVQLGQTMIQFGVAGIALKKLTMNPYLAVAAGVALVALGKALSNKASSITGGGGSSGGGSRGGSESPSALTKVQYGNRVEVTGEFELRGDTAVALIRNQQRRDERTLPTRNG